MALNDMLMVQMPWNVYRCNGLRSKTYVNDAGARVTEVLFKRASGNEGGNLVIAGHPADLRELANLLVKASRRKSSNGAIRKRRNQA